MLLPFCRFPLPCLPSPFQAFREAIPQLEKLAAAAKPGVSEASTLKEFAAAWKKVSFAHDIHSKHEDDVIFPALEAYFPGQVGVISFALEKWDTTILSRRFPLQKHLALLEATRI